MTEPAYRIGLEGKTPLLWGRFFRPFPAKDDNGEQYESNAGDIDLWPTQMTVIVMQAFLVPLTPEEEAALNYVSRQAGQADGPYPVLVRQGGQLREAVLALQNYIEGQLGVCYDAWAIWQSASADDMLRRIRKSKAMVAAKQTLTDTQVEEIRQRWREAVKHADVLRVRENEVFGALAYNLK